MNTDISSRTCLSPRIAACITSLALLAAPAAGQLLPAALTLDAPAPDSFDITFETTKGTVVMRGHHDWSPLGAARLYHLALAGYYDGAVFYRVGPTASYPGGKVIQFGLANDSLTNAAWQATGIKDEPVRERHRRGTVGFARDGADTRTVELAIDLAPNSGLDTVSYNGVVGFPPVAEVIEGLEALDRLHGAHGNSPMEDYDSIMVGGRAFLDRRYPGLDRVITARVARAWW